MCGCYELPDRQIFINTRIKRENIPKTKEELFPKVKFSGDWVYVVNAQFYSGYSGSKNEVALERELSQIPESIVNALITNKDDRVSIDYAYSIDTPINNKSNIINNNNNIILEKKILKEKKKYERITDITDDDVAEIAREYNVQHDHVKLLLSKMSDWCHAKGKSYKNYRLALIIWVKNDLERGGVFNGRPKIAVMPEQENN